MTCAQKFGCGIFKANERTFPPTGFRKLPHTILKMVAVAWWGCADSVIHSVVNKSLLLDINGITGITGTQYAVVRA